MNLKEILIEYVEVVIDDIEKVYEIINQLEDVDDYIDTMAKEYAVKQEVQK
jgi:hypothetical protein